jgi:negative regulator of replication initiation
VDEPKQAIELLRQRIKPTKKLDIKEIQPMVEMLDSDKFAARQKAVKDLQALEYSAEPIVRKLLETEQRPEVKQRLKAVLDRLTGDEFVRTRRALEVLQTINNGAAKELLRELAAGAPGNMLTSEAISRVERLTPR